MSVSIRLSPAPRRVPLSLAIANVLNPVTQTGFAVFGFGMIFFWIFVMHGDFSFFTQWGRMVQTSGVVRSVESTLASEDGARVMEHHYEFSVAGRAFTGVSYSSRQAAEPRANVTIEYLKSQPAHSRIAGMRRQMFGPAVIFVAFVPLIGFLILFFAMRSGARRNTVLRDGLITTELDKRKTVAMQAARGFATLLKTPPGQLEKIEDRLNVEQERSRLGTMTLRDPQRPDRWERIDVASVGDGGELRGSVKAALLALPIPALAITANILPILTRLGIDWLGAIAQLMK